MINIKGKFNTDICYANVIGNEDAVIPFCAQSYIDLQVLKA